MRAQGRAGRHISGAEGIYSDSEVAAVVASYVERGRTHPKGRAIKITLTVEPVSAKPRIVPALSVRTLDSSEPVSARKAADEMLGRLGVAPDAIRAAWDVIRAGGMRGAAVINAKDGQRLEPDPERGVRASRMGVSPEGRVDMSRRLRRHGLDSAIVREALTLASKVAHAPGIVAELCASDDPGYTTGYLASRTTGYVRLTHIRKPRGRSGGRVFFVRAGTDMDALMKYLETRPVMVGPRK